MRRRKYLVSIASVGVGLSGCTTDGDGSASNDSVADPDGDGPAAVVVTLYDAVNRGDHETVVSVQHNESPVPTTTEQEVRERSSLDHTVDATEVVDRSDGSTIVRANISIDGGASGTTETRVMLFEVRRERGEWRIWDSNEYHPNAPEPPSVSWRVSEQTNSAQITRIEFEHRGGDEIAAENIGIRVGDRLIYPEDTSITIQSGDTLVVPFRTEGDPFPNGTAVQLGWGTENSNQTHYLEQHTLSASTVGMAAVDFTIEK